MFVSHKIGTMRIGFLTFLFALIIVETTAQTTLTLQPGAAQGKDAYLRGLPGYQNVNYGSIGQFIASAWTNGGVPFVNRSVVEFDLSTIPTGAIVDSAFFSLYAWASSTGSGPHSTTSGSNACYIQRVTSSWSEDTVTWNSQPTTTTTNQVSIAASTNPNQDYPNIDVTTLVQDMVNNPATSFGFMIRLQNEAYFRRMNFCSSDHSISSRHPKLVVTYSMPTPTATVVVDSNVSCNGALDGGVSASISGGLSPFTYLWSNGATTSSLTGVGAGTYTVIVTDNNGNTSTSSTTLTEPQPLIGAISIQNHVSCNGAFDGSVLVNVTGGTMPYSYTWNNNWVLPSNQNLQAGTYTVTVTDANGCTTTAVNIITEPSPLEMFITTIPPICYGEHTGRAFVTSKSGGTPPYSVLWYTSVFGDSVENMPAGTYPVSLTDSKNCSLIQNITIPEKDSISLMLASTDVTCKGGNDGSLTASASGSNGGYSFSWNNGSTSAVTNGLMSGSYTVTVTDILGCTDQRTGVIGYTNELPNVDLGPDVGYGPSQVTLSTGVNGTHVWSTGATSNALTFPLASDTSIWVVVTDGNGCVNSDTINVSLYLGAETIPYSASIKLYPNPTYDQLNIQIEEVNAEEIVLQVLDYSGQMIQTREWNNTGNSLQTQISLGEYSQGVYFINLVIDGERYTQQVTVY